MLSMWLGYLLIDSNISRLGLATKPKKNRIHRCLRLLPNIRLASHPAGPGLNLSVPEKFDVAEIY